MNTILNVKHNCLDNLLAELDEVCTQQYKRVIFFKEKLRGITLNIVEVRPGVVDSLDKLEQVLNFSRELGIPVRVATADNRIYDWALQLNIEVAYERQYAREVVAC